jgi:histone H1/5
MAKSTGRKAAEKEPKKKPAAKKPVASARKPAAKKAVAKKAAARKPVAKKVAAKKPATKAKVVKAKKPATTVKGRTRKAVAKPAVVAKRQAVSRAKRLKSSVLEVSPAVIDTTAAAEVAARLVVDAHGPAPLAPAPLGNVFDTPPVFAVKRGSSALRHVKEQLHKPVAQQLEGIFGPAPVPPETMRRFLRGEKTAKTQRVRGTGNTHLGQSGVPHRSVG